MTTSKSTDSLDGKMVEEYRIKNVQDLELQLKTEIRNYSQTISKYKKISRIIECFIQICNFVNIVFAGGTMGSSGMGLLPAVLPCATITGIGTVTNTTLQMIKKNIDRKKKKHFELIILAQNTKNELQKLISRFADDDRIDVTEFEEMMTLDKVYNQKKQKLINKYGTI